MPGITLGERLGRQPLTLRDTVRLGGWLMMGLGHAHSQGILHGDVKPSNIIVNEDSGAAPGDADRLRAVAQQPHPVVHP